MRLQQLGLSLQRVSAIGSDLLGAELLQHLRHCNLSLDGLTRHQGLPTGYVTGTLGTSGDARYEIATSLAWDQIPIEENSVRAAMYACAIVFGSLAQRSSYNRASLDRLLAVPPLNALLIFDINLRVPYDNLSLVLELAKRATLLKLNATEASRLTDQTPGFGREEAQARMLRARTGCAMVCITAGEHGAGILSDGMWFWVTSRPTLVRDTVGAGDAFLAGLICGLILHRESPPVALERACRLGEFVASCDGATPPHPKR